MTAVAVSAPGAIEFKMDTTPIQRCFHVGPGSTYYWLHVFFRGVFIEHRTNWLSTKRTSFGRGGRGIKVFKVDEAPSGVPDEKWVVYEVSPRDIRRPEPEAARIGLAQLSGSAHAGSLVLRVHQEGEDITSHGKWMSIPVRTRPRTPALWRAANPGKQMIVRPSKKNPRELLLFEVVPRRGPGKGKEGPAAAALRLRFRLRRFVDMKPTLNFYEAWDALESRRTEQFATVCDRILKDIASGKLA